MANPRGQHCAGGDLISTATISKSGPTASPLRSALSVFTNPAAVFREHLATWPAPLSLLCSGLAFCLFYLQTGLDIHYTGTRGHWYVLGVALLGALVGTLGVSLLAALAWGIARPFGGERPFGWVLRAFGLAYFPALLYAVLGLAANLAWGWHTSLAFGVTGVLWAVGPMLAALREVTGQRTGPAVVLATVCGALMLGVWALIAR